MNRQLIIRKCETKIKTLSKKLTDVKNYQTASLKTKNGNLLRDVKILESLEKEAEIQTSYLENERG